MPATPTTPALLHSQILDYHDSERGRAMIETIDHYPAAASALPEAISARFWRDAALVRAKAGRTMVDLGSDSTSVFLVLEGRLQVALFSGAGRDVVLRNLGTGAMFGELSAIDSQPRSASIITIDDCVLASVSGRAFRDMVFQSPETAAWMARRLVAQIRELSERVFELNTLRVPSRLHCELLRLCHNSTGDAPADAIAPFPTHAELAARIGTHREAVTREIGFLVSHGILRPTGRRTMHVDLIKLTNLVRDVDGELGIKRQIWPAANGA
jgi:CRP/FNR family transcriptional regulator, cyclic AMP receptor protein